MCESLIDLAEIYEKSGGKLFIYDGKNAATVIKNILTKTKLATKYDVTIRIARDYSPYARERATDIATICEKHGVKFVELPGILTLVADLDAVKTGSGTHFKVFTPFYNAAKSHVNRHENLEINTRGVERECAKWITLSGRPAQISINEYMPNARILPPHRMIFGGRSEGLKRLRRLAKGDWRDYEKVRDHPEYETTQLSAYLKFGCVSPYEVWHVSGGGPIGRQLFWRDFYLNVIAHLVEWRGSEYHPYNWQEMRSLSAEKRRLLDAWTRGMTGVPIVDAGMRELSATGFMHNRVRMITASYLIKNLLIPWRWGEHIFTEKLVDFDFAQNFGNWTWSVGALPHAQQPSRVFNPEIQSAKFDPNATYIKRWIPELADIPPKNIHKGQIPDDLTYPSSPIVDFSTTRDYWISHYRTLI